MDLDTYLSFTVKHKGFTQINIKNGGNNMNKCIFTGRIASDLEVKATQNNKVYCKFSLAIQDKFNKDKTDFIKCIAWERTAEYINNWSRKGGRITVVARVTTGYYMKDDVKVYTTDFIVEEANVIDFKEKESTNPASGFYPVDDAEEDLPF